MKNQTIMPIWKQQRTEIIGNGQHLVIAKKFLRNLTSNIRVFVGYADGGAGDFVCAVNIIQHLFRGLDYHRGIFEIIGREGDSIFFHSPLQKVMQLYNVAHLYKQDFLIIHFADGLEVHFYDSHYFKKYISSFPEVELAIFSGTINGLRNAFSSFGPLNYHFETKLTHIAKARRALYFNPFTLNYDLVNYGFFSQLKDQLALQNFDSLSLGYPIYLPTQKRIMMEINDLASYNPALSRALSLLHESQASGDMTFSIYGVHSLTNPTYVLLNLIIAAKKYTMKSNKNKPLRIFLMSPIQNSRWQEVENFFSPNGGLLSHRIKDKVLQTISKLSTQTFFIDITKGMNFTLEQEATQVFRLPFLPWHIFASLFRNSAITPVYEGANTANLLASGDNPRWGLPCRRRTPQGIYVNVSDELELPHELINVQEFICHDVWESIKWWEKENTLPDLILPAMEKFSTQPRPKSLPANDRVAYAVAIVSEAKHCSELRQLETETDQLDSCQLNEAILSPFYIHKLLTDITIKGFGYGVFSGVCEQFLQSRYVGYDEEAARRNARRSQLVLQLIYESFVFRNSFYNLGFEEVFIPGYLVIFLEEYLNSLNRSTYISKKAMNALIFIFSLLPRLINYNPHSILLMLPLILLFSISLDAGKAAVKCVSNYKGTFFPPCPVKTVPTNSKRKAMPERRTRPKF